MKIELEVNVNIKPSTEVLQFMTEGMDMLRRVLSQGDTMSAEFDAVKKAVEESNTLMSSAVAGLTTMGEQVATLADQLATAIASDNMSKTELQELQSKLAELGTVADQGNDALAAWVAANTPQGSNDTGAGGQPGSDPSPADPGDGTVSSEPVDPTAGTDEDGTSETRVGSRRGR